jgi:hypothetical protein
MVLGDRRAKRARHAPTAGPNSASALIRRIRFPAFPRYVVPAIQRVRESDSLDWVFRLMWAMTRSIGIHTDRARFLGPMQGLRYSFF